MIEDFLLHTNNVETKSYVVEVVVKKIEKVVVKAQFKEDAISTALYEVGSRNSVLDVVSVYDVYCG